LNRSAVARRGAIFVAEFAEGDHDYNKHEVVNLKVVIIIPALLVMVSLCTRAPVVAQFIDQAQSNNLEKETVKGRSGIVYSVAWSYDGKTFASGNVDGTIKLWDTTTGQELRALNGRPASVGSVAWSRDGKNLASGGTDMTVGLLDAASGRELRTLRHEYYVTSVAWSSDGRTLASSSGDKTVKLWDAASGEELRALEVYTTYIYSVVWRSDGRTLASTTEDKKTIKFWDTTSSPQ
jgi:WD40 repeat protein